MKNGIMKSFISTKCKGFTLAAVAASAAFHGSSGLAKDPTPALLHPHEGEQLTRRWGYPATIKADPVTTGAKQFSAGTEDIPPGKAIPRHRHTHFEELVIVQSGTLEAHVGDQRRTMGPGSIAFAPPNTWMGFENVGNTTATIIWIFPTPGFEEYLRATSVPARSPVTPLTADEIKVIREKHKDHIQLEQGDISAYPTDAKVQNK